MQKGNSDKRRKNFSLVAEMLSGARDRNVSDAPRCLTIKTHEAR